MARRHVNDFLVGLTVLATVVVVVVASLWISEADTGRRRSRVEARFRDVGNTQVGDALVVRGVRAGQVEAMELRPGGWVHVRFAVDPNLPLPEDPVVLLGSSSLFGEWQATMMDRASLPANPEVREAIRDAGSGSDVMPGATLPDLEQLTVAAGRIAGDVAQLAERARVAFDDSAARELRSTFRSLGTFSQQLDRTARVQSRNLDVLAAELHEGMAEVNLSAGALRRTLARADSATAAGEMQQSMADARAAAANLRAATASLQQTADRLGESQGDLARLLARTDSLAAKLNANSGTLGRLVNDPSLYHNSDSLLVELRTLIADFRANPKRYVSLRVF